MKRVEDSLHRVEEWRSKGEWKTDGGWHGSGSEEIREEEGKPVAEASEIFKSVPLPCNAEDIDAAAVVVVVDLERGSGDRKTQWCSWESI